MTLLVGTRDGVFRFADGALGDTRRVLDAGNTLRVRTFAALENSAFAATTSGLFRSVDDGRTWERLPVPREEVFSVLASTDGKRLFAGTHPAHLYTSSDDGETWAELDGLQDLPSRGEWHTPRHRDEAHVRSLGVHPSVPERVVAGIEVGGVHVSDDFGTTWTERRDGVHDDVHHVLVTGPDEHVASCGGGLYSTRDAGRSWTRLDADVDHRYFRESFYHDDRLFAAAARGPPGTWGGPSGADAAIFESAGESNTLEPVSYPGGPEEFVLAFGVLDGSVIAGTNDGRVLVREESGWETLGEIPAPVRSLSST